MAESTVRLGVYTNTGQSEKAVTGLRGLMANLGRDAKSSILTGVGLGAGASAFNALAGAVQGAVAFMGDAVQAAREDETSIALLTQAIKENDASWDGNTDAIEEAIQARINLGFADDEQRASLRSLVSVTGDSTEALRVQRTAMDLARLKGMDLETATTLLGKVYAGNLSILARYGIQLEAGTTATEALAEIQRRAAGQAETWANTSEGAAETARIAFEELQEDIGKQLLPVMTELAKFARDDLIPILRDLGPVIGDIGAAIGFLFANLPQFQAANLIYDLVASTRKEAADLVKEVPLIIASGAGAVASGAHVAFSPIHDEIMAARLKAEQEARAIPGDLSRALIAGQQDVESGMEALTDLMENSLSDAAKMAYLRGVLADKELAKGLRDERADVRAAAMQVRDDAVHQLMLLESGAADAAVTGMTTFNEQIRLSAVDTGIAAAAVKQRAQAVLEFGDEAGRWGQTVARSFADAWPTQAAYLEHQVEDYLDGARGVLEGLSPPKKGPLKDIDKWGASVARAWAKGFNSVAGGFMPALGAMFGGGGMAPAYAGGGGGVIHTHIYLDGRQIADAVNEVNAFQRPSAGLLPR